ncbi:MAG: chromate transporter, partial [Acetobacteraceae bacterium]|nr:chromate transporter [Acetobacteraceae bacterium]
MTGTLLALVGLFGGLSLLAFGGGNAVVPAMQHAAVDVRHWMSDREFLEMFALSRLSPGPGSLIVTLVGQKAAGLIGAVLATAAMYAPSCLLLYAGTRLWHRTREARWRETVELALAPLAVGLVFASGVAIMRGTEHGLAPVLLTLVATGVLAATEWHPILVLAAGGAIGGMLR